MLEVLTEASHDEKDDSLEMEMKLLLERKLGIQNLPKESRSLGEERPNTMIESNSLSWYWLPRRCWKMMDRGLTMQVLGVKKPTLVTQAKLTSGRMRFVQDY